MMSGEERDRYSRSAKSDESSFGVTSIYGQQTRQGLVEIKLGGSGVQVSPAKAREMAMFLLEAASAAEGDEALMRVFDRAGVSDRRGMQTLMALRVERAGLERRARDEARRSLAHDRVDNDSVG